MSTKSLMLAIGIFACGLTATANDTIRFGWVENDYYYYTQQFRIWATANEQFTVDYGDGSAIDTMTGTYYWLAISHVYYCGFSDNYTITITTITKNCRFTNFDCTGNRLTFLELSECPDLERLGCANNQLTKLNLSGCPALGNLNCSNNYLTTLDLSGCPELDGLGCANNQLTKLNLSGCTKLMQLNCANNQLTVLDVSESTFCSFLYCNDNQLRVLKIHENALIVFLYCHNNRLQLSDLYNIRVITDFKWLGTQRLYPQEVKIGDTVDYSAQNYFDDTFTVFNVEKNNMPAIVEVDYIINDGIITFKDTGYYTVIMTNWAIQSVARDSYYQAEVITEIKVVPDSDVSIVETIETNFMVYPNPTNGALRVTGYELRGENYCVFSVTGQMVMQGKLQKNTTIVNVESLTSGIYFIKINNKVNKFVKF